jgi:hypothetical protein
MLVENHLRRVVMQIDHNRLIENARNARWIGLSLRGSSYSGEDKK